MAPVCLTFLLRPGVTFTGEHNRYDLCLYGVHKQMRKNKIEQLTEIKMVRYWYENRQISAIKSGYRYTPIHIWSLFL